LISHTEPVAKEAAGMTKKQKRSTIRCIKKVLRIPDLEHSKHAVLNSLPAKTSQESYGHTIDEFILWYCSEPRLAFNRTVVLRYRFFPEQNNLAPSTINVRLAAVRRLAYEAADTGLLSPELAAGIARGGRQMFGEGIISQSTRDDAEKNYELAVNRQQQAIVNLGVAKAAIARAEAQVEQSQAALEQSGEDLRNATIVSPIDGVVLYRYCEIGDAVSSILIMGSGATVIMTVGDLREVYVKGKVDESDIGKVYLGQPARIKVESYKDQAFTGKVTKLTPMGVETNNVTTFEVRVSISNDSRKLMATMTANAEIMLEERKGVLAIPEGAIIYKKDHSCEVEVPDATAEGGKKRIPIVTGISNGSKMQILKGLSEGQQVIVQ
jgi:HlyD family secretion protein